MHGASPDKPRTFLRAIQVGSFLALLAYGLHVGVGLGGDGLEPFFTDYVYNALVLVAAASCLVRAVRVREHRAAWAFLGVGLLSWAGAEIYNSFHLSKMEEPPYPSYSDALRRARFRSHSKSLPRITSQRYNGMPQS